LNYLNDNPGIDMTGNDIADNERWLHTPEMKAALAKADAWMRDNPCMETDLEELEAGPMSAKSAGSDVDDSLREEGTFGEVNAGALLKLKRLNLTKWDVVDHLRTMKDIAGYIKACLATKDELLIQAAVQDAQRAREKWNLPKWIGFQELLASLPPEIRAECSGNDS
jgi:hypothetical protein